MINRQTEYYRMKKCTIKRRVNKLEEYLRKMLLPISKGLAPQYEILNPTFITFWSENEKNTRIYIWILKLITLPNLDSKTQYYHLLDTNSYINRHEWIVCCFIYKKNTSSQILSLLLVFLFISKMLDYFCKTHTSTSFGFSIKYFPYV